MNIKTIIQDINNHLALKITLAIGTMGCVYAFTLLVAVPLFFPATTNIIMFLSSSFLQLVLLPVIMVGQRLLTRDQDARAEQDHNALIKLLVEMHILMKQSHEQIKTHIKS